VGRLKVTLRTQSEELIGLTDEFFKFWSGLEQKYLGDFFSGNFPSVISSKCYTRDFYEIGNGKLSDAEIAQAISEYIDIFNRAITQFFENADNTTAAKSLCEQTYKGYLQKGVKII
jgi:hypothetical protein